MMPLELEILSSLNELELPQFHVDMTGILASSPGGKKLRGILLKHEQQSGISKLTGNSLWDVTPKYQLDVLGQDLQAIADELALALAQIHIYIPFISQHNLERSTALQLTCYHLDFGFRLVSSGWDRIALILNLGFQLKLKKNCNFKRAMNELTKVNYVKSDSNFMWLENYLNGEFKKLEGEYPGLRHETTHRFTLLTRYLFENLENFRVPILTPQQNLEEWYAILKAQYYYYVQGVKYAIALLEVVPTGSHKP